MLRSRRRYPLVISCVVAATAMLLVGARAWATATIHRAESGCSRSAAITPPVGRPVAGQPVSGRRVSAASGRPIITAPGRPAVGPVDPAIDHGPAATGQGSAPRSWRAHTLRLAGCGAWRQMHDRMRHRQHGSHRGA